jgi:hypothetical protein
LTPSFMALVPSHPPAKPFLIIYFRSQHYLVHSPCLTFPPVFLQVSHISFCVLFNKTVSVSRARCHALLLSRASALCCLLTSLRLRPSFTSNYSHT